jgi:Phage integrase family
MILVAYRHGLRASELCDLEWSQIDFASARLHVRRAKNGKPATHPIRGDELRALRKLQREAPKSSFVFLSERGGPFTTPRWAREWEGAQQNKGRPTNAQLRHSDVAAHKKARQLRRALKVRTLLRCQAKPEHCLPKPQRRQGCEGPGSAHPTWGQGKAAKRGRCWRLCCPAWFFNVCKARSLAKPQWLKVQSSHSFLQAGRRYTGRRCERLAHGLRQRAGI